MTTKENSNVPGATAILTLRDETDKPFAEGTPYLIAMSRGNNNSYFGESNPNYKHGMKHTKIYGRWCGMITRTTNPNVDAYKNYGGRGIKVCPEWRYNFLAFYKWAIAHGYEEGLEIDRKDNNGNYEPSNCHFTTASVNAINKRRSSDYAIYPNYHRFYVLFTRNKKRIYLGFFETKEKAREARDRYLTTEIDG